MAYNSTTTSPVVGNSATGWTVPFPTGAAAPELPVVAAEEDGFAAMTGNGFATAGGGFAATTGNGFAATTGIGLGGTGGRDDGSALTGGDAWDGFRFGKLSMVGYVGKSDMSSSDINTAGAGGGSTAAPVGKDDGGAAERGAVVVVVVVVAAVAAERGGEIMTVGRVVTAWTTPAIKKMSASVKMTANAIVRA